MIVIKSVNEILKVIIIGVIVVVVIRLLTLPNNNKTEKFTELNKKISNETTMTQHKYFRNDKFHDDYRYLLTQINKLNSSSKIEFNLKGLPIFTEKEITPEIVTIVRSFVSLINNNLTKKNTEIRWDDLSPTQQIESGFERAQYNLGLAVSNYKTDILNTPLRLVKIMDSEKLETEEEAQIKIKISIGKVNNPDADQISLTLKLNKQKIKLSEDEFFKKKDNEIISDYKLSEVYVNGYYSNVSNLNSYDEFPNYVDAKEDNREPNADITPISSEIEFIENHYKKRAQENEYRISMLDEEGKAFNSSIMFLTDDYYKKNYRTTDGKREFI